MDDTCCVCGTNEAVVLATCEDGSMVFMCEECLSKQAEGE